jgi:hypothetical protein
LQKAYSQRVKLNILFVNHWVPGAADIHKEVQDTLPLGRITDTFRLIWG